ncbi:MAG TPA: C25 family cysteine peptidase, partial [Saprospiraceae bacterium]|nr:C25 family cysteine peptidase [Saprospiraceae bacterium]
MPCLFVLIAFFIIVLNAEGQVSNPNSSVLATGNFYKVKVEKSGLYKINKSITDKLGLSANFDLRKLKIYTNYGGHIPEEIAKSKPSDLVEIPLLISDNNNNNLLDGTDEVYFYSEGANKWFYDINKRKWTHNTNIYDVSNYVFITAEGGDGKRIAEKSYSVDATYSTSTYDQLQIFDEDRINLLTREVNTQGSGKQWFGEYFKGGDKKTYTNKFNTTLFLPNTPVLVTGLFAARSPQRGNGVLSIGNQTLSYSTNSLNVDNFEISYASIGKLEGVITEIKIGDTINLSFNTASAIGEGWLDFIQLAGRSALKYNETQFEFYDSKALTQATNYTFEGNTSGLLVWDVTKLDAISSMKLTNNTFGYPESNEISRFVAFKTKDAFEPIPIGLIKNQNLHAISQAEMVIVYPSVLKDEVLKLAKHRSEYENLKVISVEIQEIYNEFSSGRKDVSALRNFAKMLYNRDPDFKYLLLFGDATYDYRFLMNKEDDIAYIPVYETDESLNPITGFPTDDYFALLSDNEGGNLVGALDIAVGRLPVKNLKEAKDVVAKIMAYDLDPERFGDWRLSMGFTADDEDYNTHIVQADRISKKVSQLNPEINIKKMYFDVYEQVSTPGGE